MLDNSNSADKKSIKDTKSLAYGLFCNVEINTEICTLGTEFASKGE